MKRAILLKNDLAQTQTVEELTSVFESIASMRIAKIRGRVVESKHFFAELRQVYSSLRADSSKRQRHRPAQPSSVAVVITSDGKFGGGMNDKIIQTLLDAYAPNERPAIVALGSYGANKLHRQGVPLKRAFSMPLKDTDINIGAVIRQLQGFDNITVFYQTYDSLRVQKVARIDLRSTVRNYGKDVNANQATLNPDDFIFEPSLAEIVHYLESVMMGITLTQLVMEAKLADYAARYNVMSAAHKRAGDMVGDFRHQYYRVKRSESDERTKEALKSLKSRNAMKGTE